MVDFNEFILRVLFSGACGLVVGLDREIKGKSRWVPEFTSWWPLALPP